MTPETAKQMLEEAAAAQARWIRLHPDTIHMLRRVFPQDPTLTDAPPAAPPVVMDSSVPPGKWVIET